MWRLALVVVLAGCANAPQPREHAEILNFSGTRVERERLEVVLHLADHSGCCDIQHDAPAVVTESHREDWLSACGVHYLRMTESKRTSCSVIPDVALKQ